MNWPTTVGVGLLMVTFGVSVILLVRALVASKDNEAAAVKAQLQQEANMHEAERQRDVAVVAQKTAEGNLAVALAHVVTLDAKIDEMISVDAAAIKEKIDGATGTDLIAIARLQLGVPNLPNATASGGAGSSASGGGAAATPAVLVPGSAKAG